MSKMKIYLDTNTIVDFFINSTRALKKKEKLVTPAKYQFFVEKAAEIEFVTSFLTKTEIVRELISAFNLTKEEIEQLWDTFLKSLNCKYIAKFLLDERLVDVAMNYRMKLRTVVNFQHLFIAKEEGAYLLTGDKDLVEIVRKNNLYDKIITYIELRKMFT